MSQFNRQPGWYPDPVNPSKVKWWNGSAWTEEPQTSSGIPSAPSGYLAPSIPQSSPGFSGNDTPGFSYSSAPKSESMSFEESVKTCLAKYATFYGRATRSEYWYFVLFYFLFFLGSLFLTAIFANEYLSLVIVLSWVALILPTISSLVRRLHDTGRSGWWYWLSLVPFGGIVVLVFLCQQSEPAANRYGPQN
jgi:uncharacterized membrane protein YhaH (DUF805 family)